MCQTHTHHTHTKECVPNKLILITFNTGEYNLKMLQRVIMLGIFRNSNSEVTYPVILCSGLEIKLC